MSKKRAEKIAINIAPILIANSIDAKSSTLKVAVIGEWKGHNKGRFKITLKDMEQMVKNFNNSESKKIPCDYEHAMVYEYEAPASGWIEELYIKDNTLYAKVKWTSKAREYIKNGEYKYISPVFIFNSKDPQSNKNIGTTLHSVALTNTPFLPELGEIRLNSKRVIKRENMDERGEKSTKDKKNKRLKEENRQLKEEIKTLKAKLAGLEKNQAEARVNSAIEKGLFPKEQKDGLITIALKSPTEFDELVVNTTPKKTPPANDMFLNSTPSAKGGDVEEQINLEVM